ncbi:alpha-amylase domain-containing protein [Halopiger aswanensis]|uniref:Alpha-amylase n=1 Tax=Halopiger aswanensis TaxID=148449 RepID=A0A419WJ68_9EURY|nr:alpha-amylase domain-containing protein [Halopiger aswanensis]RKD95520.1 alpha-amylase [Halopiger aswanensis]
MEANDSRDRDALDVDRRTLLRAGATLGALSVAGVSVGTERTRAMPDGPTSDADGEPVLYQYFHAEWRDVEDDLQRLADLGIDGIWVPQPATPMLEWADQTTADQDGYYGDPHPDYGYLEPHPPIGYQPVDYRDFDSPYGTEAALESMIETAHEHDIDVVVDAVLNHMASATGPDGAVELPQFDRDEHFHDYGTLGEDCYWQGEGNDEERALYECDLLGLPSFDHEHPHVQREQADYIERIADLGADGLRLDAAGHVWPWYFESEINPLADDLGLWRVGEVWDGDKDTVTEFANTGMTVFDYPLYYALLDAFEGGDMTALAQDAARGIVHEDPSAAVTFVQNHDAPGPNVGIDDGDDPANYDEEGTEVELAHAYVLSFPGTPMLFLTAESSAAVDDPYLEDLIWIKRNLASGPAIDRYVGEDLYAFEREANLLAGINNGPAERTEWVETSWVNEPLVDYTGHRGSITTNDDGWVELSVPSNGWVMYAPEGRGETARPDGELTLRVTVEVEPGESVYFTGGTDELTNWGGGVEGTWSAGNVWQVTIDDPGEFEWKTRRGPSGATGDVWERGRNHDRAATHPEHQGWDA